jgi:hypothetical protein
MSSPDSRISKMSMFSLMRNGVTDLGITMLPSRRCQAGTICAGDLPCFSASPAIVGSASSSPPLASGLQASVAIACSRR